MNGWRASPALPWLLALWVLVALTGCATPRVADEAPWTNGRLSVRIAADAGRPAQGSSAAFELRGNGHTGELRLLSPLGTRLARARWAPGLAALDTGDGERQYPGLDELSLQAFGETLPLAALPDWIAGRPWAGAAHAPGAGGFEQLGWQVRLDRHTDGVIEAVRAAAPAVVVLVRLDRESAP